MRTRRRDNIERVAKIARISEDAWNTWATNNPQVNFSEWVENLVIEDNKKSIK